LAVDSTIPSDVAKQLLQPVVTIVSTLQARQASIQFTAVPKISIGKDNQSRFIEYQVWSPGKSWYIGSEGYLQFNQLVLKL